MDKNEKFWRTFGGTMRKALDKCPLTPQQAQKELDKLEESEEEPLSDDDVEDSVGKILSGDLDPQEPEPDTSWLEDTEAVDEAAFQLNRNLGEPDPEVDAKVDELRKKAINEASEGDEDDEGDQPRLEAGEGPPGSGG